MSEAMIHEAAFRIGLQLFRSPVELAAELNCMFGVLRRVIAELSEGLSEGLFVRDHDHDAAAMVDEECGSGMPH
eukprot:12908669-Prorocentrum_lima.AAC.1